MRRERHAELYTVEQVVDGLFQQRAGGDAFDAGQQRTEIACLGRAPRDGFIVRKGSGRDAGEAPIGSRPAIDALVACDGHARCVDRHQQQRILDDDQRVGRVGRRLDAHGRSGQTTVGETERIRFVVAHRFGRYQRDAEAALGERRQHGGVPRQQMRQYAAGSDDRQWQSATPGAANQRGEVRQLATGAAHILGDRRGDPAEFGNDIPVPSQAFARRRRRSAQLGIGHETDVAGLVAGVAADDGFCEGHARQIPNSCLAMTFFCTSLLPP